jgi:hypothetical protein
MSLNFSKINFKTHAVNALNIDNSSRHNPTLSRSSSFISYEKKIHYRNLKLQESIITDNLLSESLEWPVNQYQFVR